VASIGGWWLDSLMHSHNKLPALMGSRSLDSQVRKKNKKVQASKDGTVVIERDDVPEKRMNKD